MKKKYVMKMTTIIHVPVPKMASGTISANSISPMILSRIQRSMPSVSRS